MRAAALALAALCLLASSARADLDHDDAKWLATCGNSSGMAGGWSPIAPENGLPDALLEAIDAELSYRFANNLSAWLEGGSWGCTPDELGVAYGGCQQVVAGINYKLAINITCEVNGTEWTLGLDVDAYVPPGANASDVRVYDIDAEFILKDGAVVTTDIDDMDADDKWIYDATTGSFVVNPNWSDDMWDDHDDHTDDDGHMDHDHDHDHDHDDDDK